MSGGFVGTGSTQQPNITTGDTIVRLRCGAKHGAVPFSCDRPMFHLGAHMSLPLGWL